MHDRIVSDDRYPPRFVKSFAKRGCVKYDVVSSRYRRDRTFLHDLREREMSRPRERLSQRWSTLETTRGKDSTSTEESSSPINDIEYSPPVKSTSTPLRSRWSDLEQINRSPQTRPARGNVDDVEATSSDEKRLQRRKVAREKRQDKRGRARKGRHDRRGKRRSDGYSEESENEKQKEISTSESSEGDNGEGDAERSKRKRPGFREDNELPITEILRRSQENARTKYEQQPPFPVLTTDKIYVQHRDGFSAMKINQSRESRGRDKEGTVGDIDIVENQSSPPIRVAVLVQKFWKKTGLVYQGLLGGMALMHCIMLHIFFDASMEFAAEYSMISEIYASIFSLLLALCIVSSFDKFDLARFDVEHLREIYLDYNKSVIAVPLYLITFCLHQVSLKTDNHLSLARNYNPNDSVWENVTDVRTVLDDLNAWQKISMSKDLLAVLSWLFVSLGTKDDAFLIYLLSMEKYANDVESSRR